MHHAEQHLVNVGVRRSHPVNSSAGQKIPVVHSSSGRLRVRLPDPDGRIVTRLRRQPGVTSAEASKWTNNILVLFNPRITNAKELLAVLEAECVDTALLAMPPSPPSAGLAVLTIPADESAGGTGLDALPSPVEPVGYVTGFRRRLYEVLGWASVGMAVVGAILPGIPTVPFVVLAGYFFIRSSPTAHAWLLQSRWFGPLLRDWEEQRAVRRSVKYSAVGLIVAAMAIILVLGLPPGLVALILAVEIIGLIIVLRLPVVEAAPAVRDINEMDPPGSLPLANAPTPL
jgi:uncharacterized membrane protein YbaN (DUF454 family)